MLTGERATTHPQVGEITDQEASDGTQRRPARNEMLIALGGASFTNLNKDGIGYSVGTAFSWDLNRERIKLFGDLDVNDSALFVSAGIGGNHYFSQRDIAPYVGADFGLGTSKSAGSITDSEWTGGFVIGVDAGVEVLRTTSINLDFGFRIAFLLHANDFGTPIASTLRLGLYF